MSDQVISNIITLAAVALGWMLSEASGWIKSRRKNTIIKKALLAELQDVKIWAADVEAIAEEMARKISRDIMPNDILVKIAHPIFTEHFPQVCIHLTTFERLSFNAIYRLVDALHAQYEQLAEVRSKYELSAAQHKAELINILQDVYVNTRFINYRITRHLESNRGDGGELYLHKENTQNLMRRYEEEFAQAYQRPADARAKQLN